MVIRGVAGAAVPLPGAGRAGPGATGFSVSASTVGEPAGVSAPAALDGLLLLQEVEDAPARDRRARKHGRAMLDALARLQLALLGGDADAEAVRCLSALARQPADAADPALREMLGAIALRAGIELARRGL